jgi:hypothetical protein
MLHRSLSLIDILLISDCVIIVGTTLNVVLLVVLLG